LSTALELDMPTLVVARIVSIIVFAIAVPIMTLRRDRPETIMFCLALLMAVFSWAAVIPAVLTRNIFLVAIYGGCVTSIIALQWAAVVAMTGRRVHRAWFITPPVSAVAAILLLPITAEQSAIVIAVVLSAQLGAAAVFVLIHGRQVVRPSTAVLLAMGYSVSFVSAMSRPAEAVFLGRIDLYAISGDPSNTWPFFASYIGTTLITLSWLAALKDRAEARLAELAFRDELTGLVNRRALHEGGSKLWHQSMGQGTAFTFVALDLDFFKQVNDRWGHDEGDRVLAAFGATISDAKPKPAIAARMGGEEFCLIYQGADANTVHGFVERLRDEFAAGLRLPDGAPVRFSAGIVQSSVGDDGINSLYRRADQTLYEAKASGRDCAIIGLPQQGRAA